MIGHYHNILYFYPFISLWYLIHCLIHHFSRCITSHLTIFHLTQQMSTIMDIHSDKVVPLGSVIKTLPTDIFSIWHRRLHIFSIYGCTHPYSCRLFGRTRGTRGYTVGRTRGYTFGRTRGYTFGRTRGYAPTHLCDQTRLRLSRCPTPPPPG